MEQVTVCPEVQAIWKRVVLVTAIVYGEPDDEGHVLVTLSGGNAWDIQDVVDRLKFCTPNFAPTDAGPISVPLSWVAVTQLVHSFPDVDRFRWVPGPKLSAWILEEVIRRSCQGDLLGDTHVREPMDHQTAGAIAIGMNGRFLLADEPGCGKTQAALMGLFELEKRGRNPFPVLVVCPAAVIDPWLEDIAAVYPDMRPYCLAYRGPGRNRVLSRSNSKILVTSYETMRNDVGDSGAKSVLVEHGFHTVVFDECHKLCGYQTKQSVRARRLVRHVGNVIAMSGTPITKNAGNFWPILNSMYPDSYPSRDRYKARYTMDKGQDYGDEIGGLDPLREPEFRLVLQGTMRRVAKADVMKDLPPKTYQTRWVDIPAKYRPAYDEMAEDMIAHLPDAEHTTPLTAMATLTQMMRLRQLASSACDVEEYEELDVKETSETYGEMVTKLRVTPREPCWKGDALLEILAELHQDDDGFLSKGRITHGHRPVICFSPFKTLVRVAGVMAERKGYKTGYIVGGMSDKQRTETRLSFQGNELDLICVTTGAGGTGLTLTAADTVVFLNRPWSYVEALQAEDRAHRRGQLKNVQVIDLETRNSVESRVKAALQDKAGNLAELMQDNRIVTEFLGGSRVRA